MKLQDFNFRIWDKNTKSFFTFIKAIYLGGMSNSDATEFFRLAMNAGHIELWSGLRDCKGEKIYEGDIVRDSDDVVFVITFENDKGFYGSYGVTHKYKHLIRNIFEENKGFEIIGNIHKNPELLNIKEV